MTDFGKCLLLTLVSCAFSFPYPISQPVYPNSQLLSVQAVPQGGYKQPAAAGYVPQQQYVRQQPSPPVYESRGREGLQNYATNGQLLTTAVDRQVPKVAQPSASYYLNQIQSAQLASQAQEAFTTAQRTAPAQTVYKQYQPALVQQPSIQYSREPPVQYSREQPQQYVREQPQVRYISRPVAAQYRVQQQEQPRQEEQKEKEDYDHNPSYQFGFDVKDDLYTNYQNRKEQREGNKITGSYSVVDSDGFIRTVSYTADPKEGFKAEVTRQPTDIVVKVPKPDPQYQNIPRQQQQQQYIQDVPTQRHQQDQRQSNVIYQYQ